MKFDHPVLDACCCRPSFTPTRTATGSRPLPNVSGVTVIRRHTAIGDAIVTAESFSNDSAAGGERRAHARRSSRGRKRPTPV